MDPTQSDAFGGVCDDYIRDDSMFISSHMNPFNLVNYGNNKHCRLIIDAGPTSGARYRLKVLNWEIERPDDNGTCYDFLAIYVGNVDDASANNTLIGVYCGIIAPNITDAISKRSITFIWITNSHMTTKGFRILALRTETPPCSEDQFLCEREYRCIPASLLCDGTNHCDDGSDETECSGIQRFIRLFLRLGLGGIVAVGVTVVGALMLLIIVACCVKCIKQNKVSDVVFIRPNHLDIGNGTCYSNDVATEAGSNIGDWKSTNINNFAGRTVHKSECALHNF
ncbi:hypothetical protein LSH36_61g07054 [Paralvinella palmiformis]|uniref:CUB domain-containing protein n=1 Tax=Paralvinella palmiformis TaxID=53620 RepID=A0AAD9K476_9ANNE|nr:hypothetical protein LSH36_61g07054 [Paralvinella palmiformis]